MTQKQKGNFIQTITIILPGGLLLFFLRLAKVLAEKNLNHVRAFFDNELDIGKDVIVVNARLPQSPEMMKHTQKCPRHDQGM